MRYFRAEAGGIVAAQFVQGTESALDQIEVHPAIGSPTLGQALGIPGLRSWRVRDFAVVWFYIERSDHLDVVRLLGERQDIATILGDEPWPATSS